jgi:hypothetical protein
MYFIAKTLPPPCTFPPIILNLSENRTEVFFQFFTCTKCNNGTMRTIGCISRHRCRCSTVMVYSNHQSLSPFTTHIRALSSKQPSPSPPPTMVSCCTQPSEFLLLPFKMYVFPYATLHKWAV